MQVVWLTIIAVSAAPLAYVALLTNPLVFLVLGPERWRERLERAAPYRWRIVFLIAVCAFATAVYSIRYG